MSVRGARVAGAMLVAAGLARAGSPGDAGVNAFGADLFGRLAAEAPGNFVVSPYSIHAAMAMVGAGAAGRTEAEIVAALRLPAAKDARPAALRALREGMDATGRQGDVTLETANRVWVQRSYPLRAEFAREVEAVFGAGFTAADFAGQAEAVRLEINSWVEQKTRNRIANLIPTGVLTPLTTMVLVNAIYFYGAWETAFPAARTVKAPFHRTGAAVVVADLMQVRLKQAAYREEPGLQVCELPYRGRDMSMLVLLPAAGGLADLEARVARDGVPAVAGALAAREVEVALPRFKVEAQFALNATLQAMGVRDAFDGARADFSGLTGQRDLSISTVLHKAFIEVNEKGTEAAAATAVVMQRTMAMPPRHVVFRADRPFLFALRERTTGAVLFVGRVMDPTV